MEDTKRYDTIGEFNVEYRICETISFWGKRSREW